MDTPKDKSALEEQLARTEEELQLVAERYALATAAANVGVWDWNLAAGTFFLDPNIKGFLGYSDDEILNDIALWSEYIHPDDKEAVMEAAQNAIDGRSPNYVYEHRMLHKDGSVRWFLVRGEVIRDAKGKPIRFVGTDTDITERRLLEQQARELSNEVQTRIGHDLHDSLGQELTGMSLMLERLVILLREEGSKHSERAREIHEVAQSAIGATQSLARTLSPVLRASGLVRSLAQLSANIRTRHGVECRIELPEGIDDQFSDVAVNELYCIVQEAISNAIRHGKATMVEVEGRIVGRRLLLNVTDNGKGFGKVNPDSPSFGLRIMQYRARDLGGSLTISQRRDVGTLIVCSCPIPNG